MSVSRSGGTEQILRTGVGLFALAALACYRPTVSDGTLHCNPNPSNGRTCPEGFNCETDGLCWKAGHDAGSDVPAEHSDGADGMEADAGADADAGPACFDPLPGCSSSDAGACDPFCRTGCGGCRDKCTVADGDGGIPQYACAPVLGNPIGLFGLCDPSRDNCGPGLVCLPDNCGARCYAFCRGDGDCNGGSCARMGPGGLSVCDVAFADACNPVPGSLANCPTMSQGCYISFNRPAHTLCDCPGGGHEGDYCTGSRSCLFGSLCVDATGMGTAQCRRVCKLANNSQDCPAQTTCRMYYGNSPLNTPNATYGFCL
jgi:hypothetical protein